MRRLGVALAAVLAAVACARADTVTDAGGTSAQPTVDVSRTAHAAIQCNITVTTTAQTLAQLWTAASCPTALPNQPQFAFVEPTGGSIFFRTDGVTVTAANGFPILQNQAWPVEGRLSIGALQMIAASSVAVSAEVRY